MIQFSVVCSLVKGSKIKDLYIDLESLKSMNEVIREKRIVHNKLSPVLPKMEGDFKKMSLEHQL